jgi:hypothetical protein
MINQQPPIDPTKNVLDLVAAESRYRDAMRVADERYQTAMRHAETRRINDLALQKDRADQAAQTVLRLQVDNNATLFLAQMDRGFANILKQMADQSDRLSKLEQFRYESSGKGSGMSTVVGYIFAFITVAVSVAVAIVKVT